MISRRKNYALSLPVVKKKVVQYLPNIRDPKEKLGLAEV
jgi:hypothetical protein